MCLLKKHMPVIRIIKLQTKELYIITCSNRKSCEPNLRDVICNAPPEKKYWEEDLEKREKMFQYKRRLEL